MSKMKIMIFILIVFFAGLMVYKFYAGRVAEIHILKEIIGRLESDTRRAEVVVTKTGRDGSSGKDLTTIKFLEYDVDGTPLEPRYFTFSGNIIQFQSLVIRFDDAYVRKGDSLRGKSICLFWKVFMLDGKDTEEYMLSRVNEVPEGYKLDTGKAGDFEKKMWKKFWQYALDPRKAKEVGVKCAQIEAPGTMFAPGIVYTIRIENDGGMRIDALAIPAVLAGEKIGSADDV